MSPIGAAGGETSMSDPIRTGNATCDAARTRGPAMASDSGPGMRTAAGLARLGSRRASRLRSSGPAGFAAREPTADLVRQRRRVDNGVFEALEMDVEPRQVETGFVILGIELERALGVNQRVLEPPPAVVGLAQPQMAHRILVVEDNLVNQKVVVRMLRKLGCEVDIAVNGIEGVARASECEYDLILMDCQMPVMDGFEATREIRIRQDSSAPVPIVACTANWEEKDRQDCFAAGMHDYLAKPFDLDDLERIITNWVQSPKGIESS